MTGEGFEAILGGMEAAGLSDHAGTGRVATGPGFWSVLGAMQAAPTVARGDEAGAPQRSETLQSPLPPPPDTDPAAIARDLAIRPGLAAAQLNMLRRSFAGANHPDLMPPQHREAATIRMQVANRLIDEALRAGRRASAA